MADLFQEGEFDMPSTEEQQPCVSSVFKLPNPRTASDLDHLTAKLDIASFVEQALYRERHTLRTSVRTKDLHIQYLEHSRESLSAEIDSLSSHRIEVIAQRDKAINQLSKLQASHAALLEQLRNTQSEAHRASAGLSDLRKRSNILSRSKDRAEASLMKNRSMVKELTSERDELRKSIAEESKKVNNLRNQIESLGNTAKDIRNELGIAATSKGSSGNNSVAHEIGLLKDACIKWKSKYDNLVSSASGPEARSGGGDSIGNAPTRSDSEAGTRRTRNSIGNKNSLVKESNPKSLQKARADSLEWKAKYEQIVKHIEADSLETGARIAELTQTVATLQKENSDWKDKLSTATNSHGKGPKPKSRASVSASEGIVAGLQNERDEWRRKYESLAGNSSKDASAEADDLDTPLPAQRTSAGLFSPAPLQKTRRDATSESPSRLTEKLPFVMDGDMEVEVVGIGTVNRTGDSARTDTRKAPRTRSSNTVGHSRDQGGINRVQRRSSTSKANVGKNSGVGSTKRQAEQAKSPGGKRAREEVPTPGRYSKYRRLGGRLDKDVPTDDGPKDSGTRMTRSHQASGKTLTQDSSGLATPVRKSNPKRNAESLSKVIASGDISRNTKPTLAEVARTSDSLKRGGASITVRVSRASEDRGRKKVEVDVRHATMEKLKVGSTSNKTRKASESRSNATSDDTNEVQEVASKDKSKSAGKPSLVTRAKRGSTGNEGSSTERSLRPRRSVSYNYDQEGRDLVGVEQAMSLHKGGRTSLGGGHTPAGGKERRASTRSVGSGKSIDRNVATRVSTRRSSGAGSNK